VRLSSVSTLRLCLIQFGSVELGPSPKSLGCGWAFDQERSIHVLVCELCRKRIGYQRCTQTQPSFYIEQGQDGEGEHNQGKFVRHIPHDFGIPSDDLRSSQGSVRPADHRRCPPHKIGADLWVGQSSCPTGSQCSGNGCFRVADRV